MVVAVSNVHRDWMARLQTSVRRLLATIGTVDPHEAVGLMRPLALAIERAPDHMHRAVLATTLVDVCRQIVERLHERDGPGRPCACHVTAWSRIGPLARSLDGDPRCAFSEWADAFFERFAEEHPRSLSAQAAALMRADPEKPWSMTDLARVVQAPSRRLRQDFHARFGMRASTYLQLVRAIRAVALLRSGTKVEAVAWDVGYRSKKDLYAALRRWVGAAPSEVRALCEEERLWLERVLVQRTLSDAAGAPASGGTPACRRQAQRRRRAPRPRR